MASVLPAPLPALVVLLALPASAVAQTAAVEECRRADSDAARIACLETALSEIAAKSHPQSQSQTPSKSGRPSAAPESGSAKGLAAADVGSASPPAGAEVGERQIRRRNLSSAELDEQLESVSGVSVVAYSEVPYRRLQVELENGQVWRQISGDTQRLRVDLERNQTVDIKESRISGYKLRLNEMQRTIRVERVR